MEWSLLMIIIPASVLLDYLVGDPQALPHPIRWMGWLITKCEPLFRRAIRDKVKAGLFFTIILVTLTWLLGYGTIILAREIHPYVGLAVEIILIYYAISIRSLYESAMVVSHALSHGTLKEAKNQIRNIVGRDVQQLDQNGISRAAVETVAENLVDGVISPLFYAFLGGAPLAMAFKMVNTLDSMIGYKNKKYRDFGKIAAGLDDMANYFPARLSVIIISICSHIMYKRGQKTWTTAIRDGRNHTSPNAGFPEAAFAGALRVQLGGPNIYQGIMIDKPFIGKGFGKVRVNHIKKACQLMILSSILWMVFLFLFTWLLVIIDIIP